MKYGLTVPIVLMLACSASGQVTRTATLENYTPGANFNPSFTDPLSGITFRDSTHPPGGGFVVNFSPTYFGGGNYMTSGIVAIGGLGRLLRVCG